MSFFENILPGKKKLTSSQQFVMKYIMDNYEDALLLTASRLALKTNVSEATVIRLAQNLGFDGYPDMQRMFREDLQGRFPTVSRLKQIVHHIKDEGDVLAKVLQEDIQNLSQTLTGMPIETFREVVAAMEAVRRIFVAGFRGGHAPALTLALYLRFIKNETHLLVAGYGNVWDVVYGINSGDMVIAISVPRSTRLTMEIIAYAHERGAKVGVITDSLLSPLAQYADWVLPVHSQLDSFMESLTTTMSLVNALLTAISIKDPEKTLRALNDREVVWREKGVYMDTFEKKHKAAKLLKTSRVME